jgi:hypothetical protein
MPDGWQPAVPQLELAGVRQLPWPSQVAAFVNVLPTQVGAAQIRPAATGTQTPSEPAMPQERHGPAQAIPQHTPSLQNADAHSVAIWQAAPRGFFSVCMLPPVPTAPPIPPPVPPLEAPAVPAAPVVPAAAVAPAFPVVPALPVVPAPPLVPVLPLVPVFASPPLPTGPPSGRSGGRPQPIAASVSEARTAQRVRRAATPDHDARDATLFNQLV